MRSHTEAMVTQRSRVTSVNKKARKSSDLRAFFEIQVW